MGTFKRLTPRRSNSPFPSILSEVDVHPVDGNDACIINPDSLISFCSTVYLYGTDGRVVTDTHSRYFIQCIITGRSRLYRLANFSGTIQCNDAEPIDMGFRKTGEEE